MVKVPGYGEVPHEPGGGHGGPYVLLRRLEREVADDDAPALGLGALAVTELPGPQELDRRRALRLGTRAGFTPLGGVGGRLAALRELCLDPLRLALAHAGQGVVQPRHRQSRDIFRFVRHQEHPACRPVVPQVRGVHNLLGRRGCHLLDITARARSLQRSLRVDTLGLARQP